MTKEERIEVHRKEFAKVKRLDTVEIRKRRRQWWLVKVLRREPGVIVVRTTWGPRELRPFDTDEHGTKCKGMGSTYWLRIIRHEK